MRATMTSKIDGKKTTYVDSGFLSLSEQKSKLLRKRHVFCSARPKTNVKTNGYTESGLLRCCPKQATLVPVFGSHPEHVISLGGKLLRSALEMKCVPAERRS